MFSLLLFLFSYLPFSLAVNPSEGIDLASIRILILLVFFFWLAEGLKSKRINFSLDLVSGLVLSFLFLNLFSVFLSQNLEFSVRKGLFLLSIFPLYFVSRSVVSSEKKMEKAARTIVFFGAALSIVGIFQFFWQFFSGLETVYAFWGRWISPPFLGKNLAEAVAENPSWLVNVSGKNYFRAVSIFPDPHMFSFYLGILIPVSLGIFLRSRKIIYAVFFTLMLLADFLTYSRGGYAGLFAGGIFLTMFFWKNISQKMKIALILSGLILISALAFPGPVSQRFVSSFNFQEGSNQGRFIMWKMAKETTLENPFFGVGLGNYPLEVKPAADYRDPIYAHNTYLDISSETGLINAIIFILIIAISVFKNIKMSQKNIFYAGLAASLVIFSAHSFFETGIYSPAVLGLFLIILSFSQEKNEKSV